MGNEREREKIKGISVPIDEMNVLKGINVIYMR
jgi:hypothetical protein